MRPEILRSKFVLAALLLAGCSVEPEPIAYGSDNCVFCQMTIVDKTHAAQLVTRKGKQHKFDAIECLVQNLPAWEMDEIAHLLVADYGNPGVMIPAKSATFLISDEIKSPMGAYLSAFSSIETATEALRQHGGDLYSWDELPKELMVEY
jgi:copper chaperone NosL